MGDGSFGPSPFPEKYMADCEPLTLAGDGCWNCLTPDQKQTAELNLLCQIAVALGIMAECDPLSLVGDGCAACLTPFQRHTVIYQLICDLADNLTPLYGVGSPEGVVTASPGRTYTQTDVPGVVWLKISGVGNTGWAPNS